MARIEVLPEELNRFFKHDLRTKVQQNSRKLGYQYVTLDLQGYRTEA